MDFAQQAWDDFDIRRVRDVSWLGIAQIRTSTRPFDDSPELRQIVQERLAARFAPLARSPNGAAVVCGDMSGERHKFEHYSRIAFAHVDGFDLSPKSLERFVSSAFRFTPHAADCNTFTLKPARYQSVKARYCACVRKR